ncbi:hypothetical protein CYY_001648 [Polysphondylium violaceum]|uniref:Mannosyltransferase n=1 Tax=Polysphondylium violaceum TaxID=133409 RepID=A0A8J4PZS1_9MYCE|nr:hypothetical protein CYY_001648 [Polysphondylium violaceum]
MQKVIQCIDALLINTFFDPDEYWQSLEVAHNLVFGYGYMTWEWKEMIRSFLHPLIFVVTFKLLDILHLDTTYLMIVVPKLVQGIISAIGDYYLYKLSIQIFNKQVAKWALVCQLVSWYMFVCIVRTYSNSIECVLFIVSLYYFPLYEKLPQYQKHSKPKLSIALTAIAFLIRPTTAIMWIYILPYHIVSLYNKHKQHDAIKRILKFIIIDVLCTGIIILLISLCIDYYFYGQLVLVPYNFLYFNVIKNVSSFYGTHPFHWYFSQGLPAIAFTSLLFFVLAIKKLWSNGVDKQQLNLSFLTIFTVFCYSLLGHKEFRFILPILPIVMMYSGYYINSTLTSNHSNSNKSKSTQQTNEKSMPSFWIIFLLLLNIPMTVFFSNFHQRSPIDIMHYVNQEISPLATIDNPISIHLLMSCHATPHQSYIHNPNIDFKLLECPPPLNANDPIDEKTEFFNDPLLFMEKHYNQDKDYQFPNYFIIRDDLIDTLDQYLVLNHYKSIHTFNFPLDITSSIVYVRQKQFK